MAKTKVKKKAKLVKKKTWWRKWLETVSDLLGRITTAKKKKGRH